MMKFLLILFVAGCATPTLPSVYMGMKKGECNPHPKDDDITCCIYHNDMKSRETVVCNGTPEAP